MSCQRKKGMLKPRPTELKFEVFAASLSCPHLISQRVRRKNAKKVHIICILHE